MEAEKKAKDRQKYYVIDAEGNVKSHESKKHCLEAVKELGEGFLVIRGKKLELKTTVTF
jgi:hypothetical protein